MKFITFALITVPLFVARVSAQCGSGDVADYWDSSLDSSSGYSDFWSVTDGGGCDDPCGDGTMGFFVDSSITDQYGNSYADGGLQSETVGMTAPGSARSDATSYISSLPVDTPLTYSATGYTYECECNTCYKLTTFSIKLSAKLASVYFGPLRSASGGFCSYTNTACSSGTPSCSGPLISAFSYPSCYNYVQVLFLVLNGACSPGIHVGVAGPGPCS